MSLPRFYVSSIPSIGSVVLDQSEARHASNALRLGVGDRVYLFDGQGGEVLGRVITCNRRNIEVEVLEHTHANRELPLSLDMLVALPKGERQKTLIEGLVQFGATRLIPLVCERSVAQPTTNTLIRLRRSVIESSKQCGRNQLMEICQPIGLEAVLPATAVDQLSLFAHPSASARPLREIDTRRAKSARVAIGPEGGFSDNEAGILVDAGWSQVSLGPRILRIEMAALNAAAWWASR